MLIQISLAVSALIKVSGQTRLVPRPDQAVEILVGWPAGVATSAGLMAAGIRRLTRRLRFRADPATPEIVMRNSWSI